ncbi:MAG: sulfotransferase family protein [Acidimicrobiales bacterium]
MTGAPRSGTTWLSRLIAQAPGTSLPGREPMNPRPGQYALGGRLTGWVRLTDPTPVEKRILRRAYRGWVPGAYSRYGIRQWAALVPRTRLIVKDPFAVLSLSAIARITCAVPVVVYRHPAAVLASYRRMGWTADTTEIQALGAQRGTPSDDVEAMGHFWTFLYRTALADLDELADSEAGSLVVSHDELVRGGADAARRIVERCGLSWSPRAERTVSADRARPEAEIPDRTLHVFDRSADVIVDGWRRQVIPDDIRRLEQMTAEPWRALQARRVPLSESGCR